MAWNDWNEIRKARHARDKRIEILNPNAHSGNQDRRERFLSYIPFNIVGKYCDLYGMKHKAGEWSSDANRDSGMSDISWDVWKGHVRLV